MRLKYDHQASFRPALFSRFEGGRDLCGVVSIIINEQNIPLFVFHLESSGQTSQILETFFYILNTHLQFKAH